MIIFLFCFTGKSLLAQHKPLILTEAEKDSLWGIIDTKGNWYIPNVYKYIGTISEGFAHAIKNENTEGFIHICSKTFIPFKCWNKGKKVEGFENVSIFDYTFLFAFMDDKDTLYKAFKELNDSLLKSCLFYDTLCKPNYTFMEGIAPIWIGSESNLKGEYENGKWGYMDTTGTWVLKAEYKIGNLPSEGMILLVKQDTIEYYNIESKEVLKTPFNAGTDFREGFACVGIVDSIEYLENMFFYYHKGKWGYMNKEGNKVISLHYEETYPFNKGLAKIYKNGRYGFIDKKEQLVISCKFDEATDFKENRAGVLVDSFWGVINSTGEWIVKPQFNDFSGYNNQLAAIKVNDKWGYIDTTGNILIEPQFGFAYIFVDAFEKNCIDCLVPKRLNETSTLIFYKQD